MTLTAWDISFIVFAVVALIGLGIFLLNRWASKRMVEHNSLVERTKQTVSIYVIDKKKERMQNANFPKAVQEQVPKWNKLMKMPLVKAKIGPQIITLMCDKQVFDALPVKKTVKVDLAGIYIVSMKGLKTKKEMAEARRERKGDGGSVPWYRRFF